MQSAPESRDENGLPESDQPVAKNECKNAIACDFCDKTFKFKATLRQHEKIHYGIKQHECEMCHRRFLHKSTLKCHLRLHTGEKPYKCPHCPKTFRGQTALNCHIFRHTNEGAKCPVCLKVFATSSIVKQHLKQVHTNERPNVCNLCGMTYKHLKSLRLHLRNHQKRACPECGVGFDSVYAMLKHRKAHAKENLPFKCEHCDRAFEDRSKLVSHENLRGRPYQCELCCHSFNKQDYLTNHQRRVHWREMGLERLRVAEPRNGWNRKGIPKPKRSKNELQTGFVDLGVKQFKCDICEREFATKAPMLRHMKVHEIGREMACVVCGAVYYKKVDLEIHQSKVHPRHESVAGKVKPIYSCEQCGKEFIKKSNLKAHSYIHEEAYRFPCKLCSQSFKQHAGLRNHMINSHKQTNQVPTATAEQIDRIENMQPNV
uniref:C2H2-type domain-containing protein n=1 Tax=Anopheles maculatus TaxID=74869 RepID=A0A182SYR4_9DIPT